MAGWFFSCSVCFMLAWINQKYARLWIRKCEKGKHPTYTQQREKPPFKMEKTIHIHQHTRTQLMHTKTHTVRKKNQIYLSGAQRGWVSDAHVEKSEHHVDRQDTHTRTHAFTHPHKHKYKWNNNNILGMEMYTKCIYEKSHEAQIALKQKKMKNIHPAVGITCQFNSTVYRNSLESLIACSLSLFLPLSLYVCVFPFLLFSSSSQHN